MTLDEFKASLAKEAPPNEIGIALQALWQDAKGDWHAAHKLAQSMSDSTGDWVHAYLHRKEGDLSNASYWYSRVGRSMPRTSLEEEWEQIVTELL